MKKNKVKVAVGIPSMGMWHADFALNLMHLILAFNKYRLEGFDEQELQVVHVRGSILPKQRLEIVRHAQSMNADYLLWLDCDHTFPAHLLHKLISDKKEVVAINCVTKSTPSSPTARLQDDGVVYGVPCFSWPGKKLEQVWRIGTGVMLVDMKVYERTGPKIFDMYFREEVDNYQGEDWTMCEAFEKAGAEIWVDHELSLQVGHIGNLEYKHDLVPETALRMYEDSQKEAPKIIV